MGQVGESRKLQDGLTALERTRAGYSIAAAIHEQGAAVRFDQIGEDTIACFDSDRNEIVVNEVLRDASLNVLVQHLAHEGIHVQWDRPNSIDQEYYAFKAEAEVWDELKGHETDDQCDQVSQMISLGEAEAKKRIRHALPYRNLPEYA